MGSSDTEVTVDGLQNNAEYEVRVVVIDINDQEHVANAMKTAKTGACSRLKFFFLKKFGYCIVICFYQSVQGASYCQACISLSASKMLYTEKLSICLGPLRGKKHTYFSLSLQLDHTYQAQLLQITFCRGYPTTIYVRLTYFIYLLYVVLTCNFVLHLGQCLKS